MTHAPLIVQGVDDDEVQVVGEVHGSDSSPVIVPRGSVPELAYY